MHSEKFLPMQTNFPLFNLCKLQSAFPWQFTSRPPKSKSNEGLNITPLHIPTAPRQIAAKPNQISGDIDTIPTGATSLC